MNARGHAHYLLVRAKAKLAKVAALWLVIISLTQAGHVRRKDAGNSQMHQQHLADSKRTPHEHLSVMGAPGNAQQIGKTVGIFLTTKPDSELQNSY